MKKISIVLLSVLLLCGCGHVKLANGENAIVTFNEGGISSDDLYKSLKKLYGTDKLISMIDTYLLDKLYDTTTEETTYINQALKTAKSGAEELGADLDLYLQYYYGIENEDEYKDYLRLTYRRNLWTSDYAEESVSDKQINEYYEEYIVGDMEASDILITIDADSDASSDEKKKAEEKALKTAKEVIEKLKNGEDFSTLAKTYSKDESTASNGGSLGKVNDGDKTDEIIDALKELKVGSYSTTPLKASDGYHILYKSAQDDKPELDDELEQTIREKIGPEIEAEDGFQAKALLALREKYEMKITDTELENGYNEEIGQ